MFESQTKDLLFKDLTKCLVKLRDGITYKEFLGDQYYASVASLNTCNPSGNSKSPGQVHELLFLVSWAHFPMVWRHFQAITLLVWLDVCWWAAVFKGSILNSPIIFLFRSPPGVHLPWGKVVRCEGPLLEGKKTSSHDSSCALSTKHRPTEDPLPSALFLPFLITLKVAVWDFTVLYCYHSKK